MLKDYVTANERVTFALPNIEPIIKSMIHDERKRLDLLEQSCEIMQRRTGQIKELILNNINMLSNKL